MSLAFVWIFLLHGSMVLSDSSQISIEGCGKTKGCYRIPRTCADIARCTYLLTWQNEGNDRIRFEYSAQFVSSHSHPWAAFGITNAPKMPGASVVDCIVNGSSSNRVAVQMSYNDDHHNKPLNNKYLGLVESSLEGSVVSNRIVCKFTRFRIITISDREMLKVKNLTSPFYILFATGPTDGAGNKKRHDFNSVDPFPSPVRVSFDKYTDISDVELHTDFDENSSKNSSSTKNRDGFVRAHVTLMVVAWMILASVAMFTSRYMKNQWKDYGMMCGKPVWFQMHRMAMVLTLVFSLVGILLIFAHKKWIFIRPNTGKSVYTLHPTLGITVGSLLVLNVLAGVIRPKIHSAYRIYFRWFHTILGHGTHLVAAVTMYFGVKQKEANMPEWSCWIVVIFACWRLLSDVFLTTFTICYRDPPTDYVALANNEVNEELNLSSAWRCALMFVYVLGIVIMAVSLIVAANV